MFVLIAQLQMGYRACSSALTRSSQKGGRRTPGVVRSFARFWGTSGPHLRHEDKKVKAATPARWRNRGRYSSDAGLETADSSACGLVVEEVWWDLGLGDSQATRAPCGPLLEMRLLSAERERGVRRASRMLLRVVGSGSPPRHLASNHF